MDIQNKWRILLNEVGSEWTAHDIIPAYSRLFQPVRYLEFGVFAGRSVVLAVQENPHVETWLFDLWNTNIYAKRNKPGIYGIYKKLEKAGHVGFRHFHQNSNSFESVMRRRARTDIRFELAFVDGGHKLDEAIRDLDAVEPFIASGGLIVFDDIINKSHLYLNRAWDEWIAPKSDRFFYAKNYTYNGTAIAMKV